MYCHYISSKTTSDTMNLQIYLTNSVIEQAPKALKKSRHHTDLIDMTFKNLCSRTLGRKFSMQDVSGSSSCVADLRTSVSSSQLTCKHISLQHDTWPYAQN